MKLMAIIYFTLILISVFCYTTKGCSIKNRNNQLKYHSRNSYHSTRKCDFLLSIRSGFGGGSSFNLEEDDSETDKKDNADSSNLVISGSPPYLKKLDGTYTQTGKHLKYNIYM
jgi:hypothetical protein